MGRAKKYRTAKAAEKARKEYQKDYQRKKREEAKALKDEAFVAFAMPQIEVLKAKVEELENRLEDFEGILNDVLGEHKKLMNQAKWGKKYE